MNPETREAAGDWLDLVATILLEVATFFALASFVAFVAVVGVIVTEG